MGLGEQLVHSTTSVVLELRGEGQEALRIGQAKAIAVQRSTARPLGRNSRDH
jgi:hypothetical protein